jgi:hypothetical protein
LMQILFGLQNDQLGGRKCSCIVISILPIIPTIICV